VRSEVYKRVYMLEKMSDRSYLFSEVLFGTIVHDNVKRRDYVFRRMYLCHSPSLGVLFRVL